MSDGSQGEGLLDQLPLVNWVGLVAGVLMIILPFMGVWWQFIAGSAVLKFSFSPFAYEILIINQEISSMLIDYVVLAAKLTVVIGGVFMIVGSIASSRWWGRKLLSWGALKVLWMMVSLIVLVVIGTFFMNEFLPSLISKSAPGNTSLEFSLPYLLGSGHVGFDISEAVELLLPVKAKFTSSFWLALLTVGFGVGARFYNGKIKEKLKSRRGVEESKSNKEAVEKGKKEETQEE